MAFTALRLPDGKRVWRNKLYFGSVRFFKHLIITVLLAMIIVPTVLAIVFGVQNDQKGKQVEQLEAENASMSVLVEQFTGNKELTAGQLYRISQDLGVSSEELVNIIYSNDKAAFSDVIAGWTANNSAPDTTDDDDFEATNTDADTVTDDVNAAMNNISNDEPSPYAELYPELYVQTQSVRYVSDDNCIYLTFDDGPSEYTLELLDILDRHDIKATFFVIPEDTEESFTLMKEIVSRGHAIGIHTYSHDYNEIYSSVKSYLADFSAARELIYKATGIECTLYRFPGGSKNSYNSETGAAIINEMNRRGFVYFDWNVDSEDAVGANWTTMYYNVLNEVAGVDRAVILMHDGIYNTTLVLEDIINALTADARDFTFSAITDEVKPLQF